MKIVICTNLYPVGGRQGAMGVTAAIRDLVHEIKKEVSFTVLRLRSFLNRNRYAPPKSYTDEEVNIYDYPIFPFASAHMRAVTRLINKKHYKTLKESDAIVCHMADQAYEILKLFPEFSNKLIYVMHSNDILQKKFMEYALRHSTRVLTRSQSLKKYLEVNYDMKVFGIVFSGINDIECAYPQEYSSDCTRILYAGSLIKRKNVDLIIEASKLVEKDYPHLEVLIVGDGPELSYLKSISPKFIKFFGSMAHSEVIELMGKCEIFIMPSIRETLGLVYLEAMRQKCIVIGTSGEGIDGVIVDGENGFLIDELTPERIKDKLIIALSADSDIRHKAYETSLDYKKEFASSNYKKLINLNIM